MRRLQPAERQGERGRAGTHLHTPPSGTARAAAAPARTAADSCCSRAAAAAALAGGGEAGCPEASEGARAAERAGGRGARVIPGPAGWPAAALARRLLSCSLPLCGEAALPSWPRWEAPGLWGGGGRRALSKRLAARPLFLLPVAPAASENAPRSLQGLHFVAHGLAASPLGHVVIGRAGGGARKRERERASRTAPLPARTRQPQPGREREPRGGPTTKAARQL